MIRGGGFGWPGAIYFTSCDGTLSNSLVQHSASCGVNVATGTPVITGMTWFDNAGGDLCP